MPFWQEIAMRSIFFISGPCGCGKTTFADAFARHLVQQENRTVYVIHGDAFHAGQEAYLRLPLREAASSASILAVVEMAHFLV